MGKHTQQSNATAPAANTLRATRVAVVQAAAYAALRTQQAAARMQRVAAAQHAKQQAYMLAVQQLAAQYGIDPAHNTLAVRTMRTAQQHAPSAQAGACKQVHTIAAQCNGNRAATLAACKLAGINPATAATQYAKYRKAHMTN